MRVPGMEWTCFSVRQLASANRRRWGTQFLPNSPEMPALLATRRCFDESGNDGRTHMNICKKPYSLTYCILLGAGLCTSLPTTDAAPPLLALANDYEDVEIDLSRYWVSEKYSGMMGALSAHASEIGGTLHERIRA
jgi:hypothetical protein